MWGVRAIKRESGENPEQNPLLYVFIVVCRTTPLVCSHFSPPQLGLHHHREGAAREGNESEDLPVQARVTAYVDFEPGENR